MIIQLNRDEQARVDRYAELQQARRAGQLVHDYQLAEAKQHADLARWNAEARARYQAKLDAERQAKAEYQAAAKAQRVQAEIDAMKQQARAGFIGSDSRFEDAWPDLLRRWQINRAIGNDPAPADRLSTTRAEQRATGRYNF